MYGKDWEDWKERKGDLVPPDVIRWLEQTLAEIRSNEMLPVAAYRYDGKGDRFFERKIEITYERPAKD